MLNGYSGRIRRVARLALVAATAIAFTASVADARTGGGSSSGSRGGRTFTAPPSTNTAPSAVKPMERSMTQPGATAAARPGAAGAATAAQQGSRFGTFGKLLMGGLIGAGLMSMLGMGGGLAAVLGFIMQALLIGGLIWLAVAFFRSRRQPAPVPVSVDPRARTGAAYREAAGPTGGAPLGGALGSMLGSARGAQAQSQAPMGNPLATGTSDHANGALEIGPSDYEAFEGLLARIQDAYGREDVDTLGDMATPEMLSYMARDIAENAKKGVRNEVSGAKLLQGDLAESWTEPGSEYATVAMRFSLFDATVDRNSGKVLSGSRTAPDEVTEVWTFRRDPGAGASGWQLSAIQQVS